MVYNLIIVFYSLILVTDHYKTYKFRFKILMEHELILLLLKKTFFFSYCYCFLLFFATVSSTMFCTRQEFTPHITETARIIFLQSNNKRGRVLVIFVFYE